jgi:hypothetical protein
MSRPYSLYRFYDASGTLLYVGITDNGIERWANHSTVQVWWPDVAEAKVTHIQAKDEASIQEIAAIVLERPLHNQQHNTQATRDRLEQLRQSIDPDGRLTPTELARQFAEAKYLHGKRRSRRKSAWAATEKTLVPARAAAWVKYLDQVDPERAMTDEDRERAARHALTADMQRLAMLAVKARKGLLEPAGVGT